jgi:hypothetical protein
LRDGGLVIICCGPVSFGSRPPHFSAHVSPGLNRRDWRQPCIQLIEIDAENTAEPVAGQVTRSDMAPQGAFVAGRVFCGVC